MLTKLKDYLQDTLHIPVLFERPPDARPDDVMVVLQQTGEALQNQVTTYTVAALSYAPTLLTASNLNDAVETAILTFGASADSGATTRLETSYNFTAGKTYRYQAVFQITFVRV